MAAASWLRSCWRSKGERVERVFCAKLRAFVKAGEGCGGVGVVREGVGGRVAVFLVASVRNASLRVLRARVGSLGVRARSVARCSLMVEKSAFSLFLGWLRKVERVGLSLIHI